MSLGNFANLAKYALCLLLVVGVFAISSQSEVHATTGLPMGDIVFVFDESGTFFDDHDAVKRNLNVIVPLLKGVIDYQFGLVGFGSYRGHGGTSYAGQPHVHQTLTPDVDTFSEAMDGLVKQGKPEYGYAAIQLATSDQLGFRAGAAPCVIMITDEDADISVDHPVTRDNAIAAIQRAEAFFLGVIAFDFGTSMEDYGPLGGSIAQVTGGQVFDIEEFREDPAPVLREIIASCILNVQENGVPDGPPDTTPPDNDNGNQDGDGGGGLFGGNTQIDLAPIVTRLIDEHGTIFARLRIIEEKLNKLDVTIEIPVTIDERFLHIERTIAGFNVFFENIDANFTQIDARFGAIEQGMTSIRASIAELHDNDIALAARMSEIETRLSALEANGDFSELLAWREAAEAQLVALHAQHDGIMAELESLRASHAGFGEQFADLTTRLNAVEAHLSDLSASLNARIAELEAHLAAFDARFAELNAQLENLDVSALSAELSGLRAIVNQNTNMIETLRGMAATWDQDIADLNAAVSDLSSQLAELQSLSEKVAELQASVDTLAATTDTLDVRVTANEDAISSLTAELHAIQLEIEDLLQKLDDNAFALQADLDSLASSLGSRIQSLLRRIQSLEAAGTGPDQETLDQLESLANLISQLQVRMAELTSKQNAHYEELTSRIDLNEEWIMMIEAWLGLGDNKEGQTNIDARMAAIESALSDLSAQLRESQRSIGDIQRSVDELRDRVGELEARPAGGDGNAVDPARLRAAQRLAELAFLTSVAAIGLSLLFFLSNS